MSEELDIVASDLCCGDVLDEGATVVAIVTNHAERELIVTLAVPGKAKRHSTFLDFDAPLRVTRGARPIVRVN